MKRILCLALIGALLLAAVGCHRYEEDELQLTDTEPLTVTETETSPESEPSPPPADTEPPTLPTVTPSDFECHSVSEWQYVCLTWRNVERAISLPLPKCFSLQKHDENTYLILHDGEDVGDMRTTESSSYVAVEAVSAFQNGNVELSYQLRRVREGSGEGFRHVFYFYYMEEDNEHTFCMELDYTALDSQAARYICNGFAPANRHSGHPIVSLDGGNDSNVILIAGNSAIASSEVGICLSQFMSQENQPYEVHTSSIYAATLSRTYALGEWNRRIRDGQFHAVVVCGLYSASDVRDVAELIIACKASNTRLILFPSHNETDALISSAMQKYPDLPVVNWRREINYFIDSGVDPMVFYTDDETYRSNQLAGYVGAHALYMALFGEAPSYHGYEELLPLDMDYVRNVLGTYYVKTGLAPNEPAPEIIEFVKP